MWLSPRLYALPVKAAEKFAKYASFSPTPLSLKKLSAFGKFCLIGPFNAISAGQDHDADIVQSTRFLRTELPVRIANILQELHLLPKKLLNTPSASLVTSL